MLRQMLRTASDQAEAREILDYKHPVEIHVILTRNEAQWLGASRDSFNGELENIFVSAGFNRSSIDQEVKIKFYGHDVGGRHLGRYPINELN